jgi:hypothetical protein
MDSRQQFGTTSTDLIIYLFIDLMIVSYSIYTYAHTCKLFVSVMLLDSWFMPN